MIAHSRGVVKCCMAAADVVEVFKATGKGWQTRVNHALRQYVAEHPFG